MTLEQFNTATNYVQRTIVQMHGSFLLKRKVGNHFNFLYDVDGFYVVVSTTASSSSLGIIMTRSIDELDEYLSLVDISEITALLV